MNGDPFVGKMIDNRYEIRQRIGEGGMGVVYKARQISIDRVIALKMLNQQMANDPTWVQRFYNEAKAVLGGAIENPEELCWKCGGKRKQHMDRDLYCSGFEAE